MVAPGPEREASPLCPLSCSFGLRSPRSHILFSQVLHRCTVALSFGSRCRKAEREFGGRVYRKKPVESPGFPFRVPSVLLSCSLAHGGLETVGCVPAMLCRAAHANSARGAQEPLEGGRQASLHRAAQAGALGRSQLCWHPRPRVSSKCFCFLSVCSNSALSAMSCRWHTALR